ncbi:MAG: serine hydrolase [Lachnospiraceae bacterium]|nr:serine hydrolase [Candidatus Equihabitans merdae]
MNTSIFPMTSPESLGIKTEGITRFLSECQAAGLELHRFMLVRHGLCCAKVNWAPYSETDWHPMYSFSKSLTATAIGFARQEGLLSLDERLVDLFPDELLEEISENLAECTIHHLLCMSCGHETEIQDQGPDWKKTFLAHPFLHKPGTFFKYNTAGTNMLAAIVKKKTGLQVLEYLRPRLLDPLGMGQIFCLEMPDEEHTQHGGGGMRMQLEDMARFTQFMLQDGVWEGKTLLADWYSARAGVKQMETAGDSEGHVYDWAMGYGYQCWMGSLPKSYRADGAFGQFGLVFPTLDLCVMINAATEQTQTMQDIINQYLLPAVEEDGKNIPVGNNTDAVGENVSGSDTKILPDGQAFVERRSLMPLSSCRNPRFEQQLEHAVYIPLLEGSPLCSLQQLVGGAGRFVIEKGEITQIRFHFEKDKVLLYLTDNGCEKTLAAALNGRFLETEIDGSRYAATARWRSLRKLEMEIRRMDAMSGVRLILKFEEDRLNFEADDTLMTDGGLGMVDRPLVEFVQVADLKDVNIEVTGNNPGAK